MMAQLKDVRFYMTAAGRVPAREWLDGLRDRDGRNAIEARIARLSLGLLGRVREVGAGVHELKIEVGPGYRVYFANDGVAVVIILTASDKSTQKPAIKRAKEYWRDYQERKARGEV
jgi:putative addiction module killer protein